MPVRIEVRPSPENRDGENQDEEIPEQTRERIQALVNGTPFVF